MAGYFITGTDTDVGKTIVSAWVMAHIGGYYWKPTQSGTPHDVETVKDILKLPADRIIPSAYVLQQPLSPHEAAKRDGIVIEAEKLKLPNVSPLVVEGAGGLMVPLNDHMMVIDLIEELKLPVILVARSKLGTINHTLLSLLALRTRDISIKGIVMNGPKAPHNRQALEQFGGVPIIAEIPELETISRETLLAIPPDIKL